MALCLKSFCWICPISCSLRSRSLLSKRLKGVSTIPIIICFYREGRVRDRDDLALPLGCSLSSRLSSTFDQRHQIGQITRQTQYYLEWQIYRMAVRRLRKFLPISEYNTNDPLLEAATSPLNLKKLPRHLSRDLQLLRSTAAHHQLVSLAANQIRMPHRVFAVLKQPLIQVGKWNDYNYQDTDYELVANPKREGETAIKFKGFEECPSVPGMRFAIWNPILQTYHFQQAVLKGSEVHFESSQRTLAGFIARIWDHEARHLDGLLAFSEDISHGQAYVCEDFRQNPGMHQMVELIKQEIGLMSKESLKTFFKQSSSKEPVVSSMDQLPEKITNQLRTRLTKQRTKIKDRLDQQTRNPDPAD